LAATLASATKAAVTTTGVIAAAGVLTLRCSTGRTLALTLLPRTTALPRVRIRGRALLVLLNDRRRLSGR